MEGKWIAGGSHNGGAGGSCAVIERVVTHGDVWSRIAARVPLLTRAACSRVCRAWKAAVEADGFDYGLATLCCVLAKACETETLPETVRRISALVAGTSRKETRLRRRRKDVDVASFVQIFGGFFGRFEGATDATSWLHRALMEDDDSWVSRAAKGTWMGAYLAQCPFGWTELQECALLGDLVGVRTILQERQRNISTCSPWVVRWDDNMGFPWGTPLHFAAKKGQTECLRELLAAGMFDVWHNAEEWGGTACHLACIRGCVECLRQLLEAGAKMEALSCDGSTPLTIAAYNGRVQCVRELLAAGAKLGARNKAGMMPIHCAADRGNHQCMRVLLEAGADVNAQSTGGKGSTPLIIAATRGWVKCVKLLLRKGADTEKRLSDGFTPLMLAAWKGEAACVRALLRAGADKDAMTGGPEEGWEEGAEGICQWLRTALVWAAGMGHVECVRELLHAGADTEAIQDGLTATGLQAACHAGSLECVRELLKHGACVNPGGPAPPLVTAAGEGHLEIVRALLAAGADPHARLRDGATGLHRAAMHGRVRCLRELVSHGLDLEARVHDPVTGNTPLHVAVLMGQAECVRALVEEGADLETRYGKGERETTALTIAASAGPDATVGKVECMRTLLDLGADWKAVDGRGRTPLQVAREEGDARCVSLLEGVEE